MQTHADTCSAREWRVIPNPTGRLQRGTAPRRPQEKAFYTPQKAFYTPQSAGVPKWVPAYGVAGAAGSNHFLSCRHTQTHADTHRHMQTHADTCSAREWRVIPNPTGRLQRGTAPRRPQEKAFYTPQKAFYTPQSAGVPKWVWRLGGAPQLR